MRLLWGLVGLGWMWSRARMFVEDLSAGRERFVLLAGCQWGQRGYGIGAVFRIDPYSIATDPRGHAAGGAGGSDHGGGYAVAGGGINDRAERYAAFLLSSTRNRKKKFRSSFPYPENPLSARKAP